MLAASRQCREARLSATLRLPQHVTQRLPLRIRRHIDRKPAVVARTLVHPGGGIPLPRVASRSRQPPVQLPVEHWFWEQHRRGLQLRDVQELPFTRQVPVHQRSDDRTRGDSSHEEVRKRRAGGIGCPDWEAIQGRQASQTLDNCGIGQMVLLRPRCSKAR